MKKRRLSGLSRNTILLAWDAAQTKCAGKYGSGESNHKCLDGVDFLMNALKVSSRGTLEGRRNR